MRLYSTLSRQKEELPPPEAGPIGMYVCGPTVYQRAHIGNARPFVIFAWLRNWLRESGYEVEFVHNITDVDDKILAAPGPSADVAAQATEWYLDDIRDLGLGLPDETPKATETIPEIVAMIGRLVAEGYAYAVGGDVYFRVARYLDYGQLSGQRPNDVAEQEPNSRKEDPRDFALWKASKPDEDLWWESPWGRGRPGWHIECSAMAEKFLGPRFEIHGSGRDIVFPHNENELAQSRALGSDFAHIWMHNGMLRFTGEKMSKSLGNVMTIREALDTWGRETLLLFFMTAHWSKPIDFSDETLEQARAQKESFQHAHRLLAADTDEKSPPWTEFERVLNDDFDTPAAIALLHAWRRAGEVKLMDRGLAVFGLTFERGEETHVISLDAGIGVDSSIELAVIEAGVPGEVQTWAAERHAARRRKDFRQADELRAKIEAAGFQLMDLEEGYRVGPRA